MKKNESGQSVGAEIITAADGTAFTGAVSVFVTVDNGTQGVGAGTAPAHEGNGYHSYTPTQAETNGDHIAFTFTGTGAIPATVQVFSTFPQTGDNYARLGAPAGASVSADNAAIKLDSAAVKTKTDFLPSATAGNAGGVFIAGTNAATTVTTSFTTTFTGSLTGSVGSVTGGVGGSVASVTAINTTGGAIDNVTTVATNADMRGTDSANTTTPPTANAIADQVWDELLSGHAVSGSTGEALSAAGTAGDPWTTSLPGAYGAGTAGNIVGNNLDVASSTLSTQASVDAIDGIVNAILVDTNELQGDWTDGGRLDLILDQILADTGTDGVVISATTANQIADAILNRDFSSVSDTNARTAINALRFLRNKYSVTGTTLTVTKEDDSTSAWTSTLTVDAAADPVTGSDPA